MKTENEIKSLVKEKYGEIANENSDSNAACCGSVCCDDVSNIMSDSYAGLKGYHAEADLGLGCGLPTKFAGIKSGNTVVDLGSGAGNDCFIARAEAGESGKIIGIDITDAMIQRARKNAEKLGYNNVEFRLGEIENIPLSADQADVVVSNCVLNLVPNKSKAFSEIFRILKPGGHFSISDIVTMGNLPGKILASAEMYAGCVAGAIKKEEYLEKVREAGFVNVSVQSEKRIGLPNNILKNYLSESELEAYKRSEAGLFSITVYAEKPGESCCDKETCCK